MPNATPKEASCTGMSFPRSFKVQYPTPIRSSGHSDYQNCKRFFMYRWRLGLTRIGRQAKALTIGSLYHEMMANLALGLEPKDALVETYTKLETELNQAQSLCNPETMSFDSGLPFEKYAKEQEEAFSFAKMLFTLSYESFFSGIQEIQRGQWKTLLVETPIQISLSGIEAPLRCKPDLLLVTPDNKIIIVDYKTTSKPISSLVASYRWDFQMLLMALIVSRYYAPQGYTVKGFLHCLIRKPTIKFPTRNSPTFDDYIVNCKQWFLDQEAKNPNEPMMARSLLSFDSATDLSEEFFNTMKDFEGACTRNVLSPALYSRNSKHCMGMFGNSQCPYFEMCMTNPMFWTDFIEKKYKQEFREDTELDLLEKADD